DMADNSQSRSSRWSNFLALVSTPRTRSLPSLLINQWRSSKRILHAFYHVSSICEFQSTRPLDGTRFGVAPPVWFRKNLQPSTIRRFSILARYSASHANRNAEFARSE